MMMCPKTVKYLFGNLLKTNHNWSDIGRKYYEVYKEVMLDGKESRNK